MQPTSLDSFYAHIAADPALQQQLTAGTPRSEELVARAVAEGQRRGYIFSPAEVAQWLAQRSAAAASVPEELSDEQLEVVAGGKDRLNKVDFGPMRTRP